MQVQCSYTVLEFINFAAQFFFLYYLYYLFIIYMLSRLMDTGLIEIFVSVGDFFPPGEFSFSGQYTDSRRICLTFIKSPIIMQWESTSIKVSSVCETDREKERVR